MTKYVVEVRIEEESWEPTEFAHSHAAELYEMGEYEAVFFERTGEVALLREVEE